MGNLCGKEKDEEESGFEDEDLGDNGGIIVVAKKKKKLDPKDFVFEDKKGETLVKMPKSINGQQFIVRNCTDCDVFLLDYSGQVIIENCTNCFVFVAPCESSVYFRDCKQCRFILACQQMRTRDCEDIELLLFCGTRPTIEATKGLRMGCFDFGYFELAGQFVEANLKVWNNPWSRIHDFSPRQGAKPSFTMLPKDHKYTSMFNVDKLLAQVPELKDAFSRDATCPVPRTHAEPSSEEEEEKLYPHDSRCLLLAFSDAVGKHLLQLLRPALTAGDVVLVRTLHLQQLEDVHASQLFGPEGDSRLSVAEGVVALDLCAVGNFDVEEVANKDASGLWWMKKDYGLVEKVWSEFIPSDQI